MLTYTSYYFNYKLPNDCSEIQILSTTSRYVNSNVQPFSWEEMIISILILIVSENERFFYNNAITDAALLLEVLTGYVQRIKWIKALPPLTNCVEWFIQRGELCLRVK